MGRLGGVRTESPVAGVGPVGVAPLPDWGKRLVAVEPPLQVEVLRRVVANKDGAEQFLGETAVELDLFTSGPLARRLDFAGKGGPLRAALDAAGGIAKKMVLSLDGSFSNRTVFLAPRDRTELIARTRLDAVLCKAAPTGSRRFYGVEKFRPEQVRRDETIVWKTTKLFYGGKRRKIRYKEVNEVYWQGGARRTPLRLLVVAPTPYSKRLSSKMYYRQPAYLLTTDLASQARELLQIYFDRWQIEVNHREEKDTLGWDSAVMERDGGQATGMAGVQRFAARGADCAAAGGKRQRAFLSGSGGAVAERNGRKPRAGSAGAQTLLAGLRRRR